MKTASTALPILTNILQKNEGRCLLVPDLKMFAPDKINKYCVSVLVFISKKTGWPKGSSRISYRHMDNIINHEPVPGKIKYSKTQIVLIKSKG